MAQRWYYARGGQKIGPVTSQELRYLAASGTLQPTDLVWADGMTEWKEARSVVGLFPEANGEGRPEPHPLPGGPIADVGSTEGSGATGGSLAGRKDAPARSNTATMSREGPATPAAIDPNEPSLGEIPTPAKGNPERLEIRPTIDKKMMSLLTMGYIIFTLGGFLMMASGERVMTGLLAVLFFGGGGLYAIPKLLHRPVSMVLSREGIEQRGLFGTATIRWEDVERVGLVTIYGNKLVGLRLARYDGYLLSRKDELVPLMKRFVLPSVMSCNRLLCGYDIAFSWADLDRPGAEFVGLLELYKNANASEPNPVSNVPPPVPTTEGIDGIGEGFDGSSKSPRRAGRMSGTDGVVDPALDLDRLRSRLTRHAGAIPHHQIDDLGSAIEVWAARRIPVYRIAWRTLFEGRQVVERQAPHDGSMAFPPPKHRRQGFDPWTIPLPAPIDFSDRSSELPVEGSESVHGCGECGSVGHVTCDNCQGQKAVACGQCGGGGLVRCGTCSGTGRTYQVQSEQRTRICSNAGPLPKAPGTGFNCRGGRDERGNVCPRCNGTGKEEYIHQERYPVPCMTCSGQGRHACQTCGGGRVVACPRCGGHGQLTCPACQGHRRVVQFLAVVRSHEAKQDVAVIPADDCPEEAIRGLDPSSEFREALTRSSFGALLDASLDPALQILTAPVRALRDKVQAQGGDDRRRAGDRLHLTEAQVVRLDYAFEGREYTAWFAGEDGPVHAPDSPVTEVAARHIEDALAAWKEGRQKDAIRALRPAVAMAKKSPECRAALEARSPRIPEELMRRGSAFSLSWWVGNAVKEFRLGLLGIGVEKRSAPVGGVKESHGSNEPAPPSSGAGQKWSWRGYLIAALICLPVVMIRRGCEGEDNRAAVVSSYRDGSPGYRAGYDAGSKLAYTMEAGRGWEEEKMTEAQAVAFAKDLLDSESETGQPDPPPDYCDGFIDGFRVHFK